MRAIRISALLVFIAIGALPASAQQSEEARHTLVTRGVPLGQALEQLAYATRIDIIYSSADVANKRSYCNGKDLPVGRLLSCILDGSGLEYVRSSSGAYVLIDSIAAGPRFGHLAGSITDAVTGEPLPYANVLLADARTGTSTNEAGLFNFATVLSGPHRIVVTYVGYETATDSIWVEPGGNHRLRVSLKSAESTMAPIVVNGLTQRLPSSGLGRPGRTANDLRLSGPAVTSNITRGLTAITGVAVQQPLADLHIQGSGAGEHVTLLDGVPVRDPVSMGRYLSAFSPLALGRVTVHKAGFGADAGSNLAGVVEVEHDVSSLSGDRFAFSVDPVSVNARAETRFQLAEDDVEGSAMAALRTGIWSAYRDPAVSSLLESWHGLDPLSASSWIGHPIRHDPSALSRRRPDVQFSDFHSALRLQLSPFRTVSASVYRARNSLESDYAGARSSYGGSDILLMTRDKYDWTNWVGQIGHSWLLGARAAVSTQFSGSWNQSTYAYYGLYDKTVRISTLQELDRTANARSEKLGSYPATDEDNDIRELAWRTRVSYSLSSRHQLDAGIASTHVKSHFLFKNPFVDEIAHDSGAWQHAAFAEGRYSIGLGTRLEPGVRLTYLPNRRTVYAEPRLAVRHDAAAGRFGTVAIRLAGGVYRQFITQLDVSSAGATTLVPNSMVWLPLDGSLAPPRAYHAAAEFLLMPNPSWTVSLEAYKKWQQRLLVLDYAALARSEPSPQPLRSQRHFMSATSGEIAGASLRLRREGGPVDPVITYSFVHAQRRFPGRFGGEMQPLPWNAPHRISADITATLAGGFRLLMNGEANWGRTWALRRSYYDYIAFVLPPGSTQMFDLADPSSSEVPAYYRLDVGISYGMQWNGAAADLRLFVTNVMNRRNVYDYSLQQESTSTQAVPRLLPGRHVFASLRLGF